MSIADQLSKPNGSAPVDAYTDPPLFEVVDGIRVELPMSAQNAWLGSQLLIFLASLIHPKKLGHVVHELLFELPLSDRSQCRRPDLAFVSFVRWPEDRLLPDRGEAWPVVPDLAIELLSPNDEVDELDEKLQEYFEAGVRQVWVVHSRTRVVYQYRSLTDVKGFQEPAEIDGGEILPGIRVPVAVMLPPRLLA